MAGCPKRIAKEPDSLGLQGCQREPGMKKVLIVTTISGFLAQFEMNDVGILKNLGCELHYASNFRNPVYESDQEELKQQGIKLYQIDIEKSPIHLAHNIKAFYQICKVIREEGIELLHCHNPLGGVLGRLAAFFCGSGKVSVIYTAHGFHFYNGAPLVNWLFYFPAEAMLARFTDCLITINEEDYKRTAAFRLKGKQMRVQIPGVGVRTEKFRKEPKTRQRMRRSLGIGEDIFYILSVGEVNKNKNHEVILRALAKLGNPKIHYGICGKGKRADYLNRLAEELGIGSQFKMYGFRRDIPDMLQCADCFAFPSKREGLGIAAIEAMAGGIPLITSDCRGTREYMEDGVTGYICRKGSVEEYARAISKMWEDAEGRKRMGMACRERAGKFDLSETDRIMKKVYRRMADSE